MAMALNLIDASERHFWRDARREQGGQSVAQCRVTDTVREGTCFLPFHWGRQWGFYKAANNLTLSARDPVSKQPELKACAVRLRSLTEHRR